MYLFAAFVLLGAFLSFGRTRKVLFSESLTAFTLVAAVAWIALVTGYAAA